MKVELSATDSGSFRKRLGARIVQVGLRVALGPRSRYLDVKIKTVEEEA